MGILKKRGYAAFLPKHAEIRHGSNSLMSAVLGNKTRFGAVLPRSQISTQQISFPPFPKHNIITIKQLRSSIRKNTLPQTF
jgi:hypothetical protein